MSNGKPCASHQIPVDLCTRCKGAAEERERIIALMYEALAYYNRLLVAPKSVAFANKMENRKNGIMEAIKLMRMTEKEADDKFKKQVDK